MFGRSFAGKTGGEHQGKAVPSSAKSAKGSGPSSGADVDPRKVFVGGLPKHLSPAEQEEKVLEYFSQFGPIEEIKMMPNESGQSRGFCFLTFETADGATAVMDNYDSNELEGQWVDCKPAARGKGSSKGSGGSMGGMPPWAGWGGMTPWDMMAMMWSMKAAKGWWGAGGKGWGDGKGFGNAKGLADWDEGRGASLGKGGAGGKKPVAGGSAPSEAKPGDWMCPVCGDLVFAKRTSCNMCGFGGGLAGLGPAAASGARGAAAGSASGGGKPGDWFCSKCGDLVFSYRDKCNQCGAPKAKGSERIGVKKGDWACPTCGDLVFASKDICSMCKTPKPEGLEDGEYGPCPGSGRAHGKGAYSPY